MLFVPCTSIRPVKGLSIFQPVILLSIYTYIVTYYYATERVNNKIIIMDTEGHQNATPNAADRFDIPERFLRICIAT